MAEKPKTSSNPKHVPKDAQVIVSIMKDMGIADYEPKVINQLLEFTYRYVTCILDDSKVYANHGKKKFIDIDDVRLAIKMQTEKSFTNPPPREVLLDVAKIKNNIPLPFVKPSYGLRLPPDRYCLNGANYKLKSLYRKSGKLGNSNASGGRINQGYSLVKRPGLMSSANRTQTITMSKPISKVMQNTASTMSTSQQMKPKIPSNTDAGPMSQLIEIKPEPDESNKRKREDDDYDVP